jgi:hypothetical protein
MTSLHFVVDNRQAIKGSGIGFTRGAFSTWGRKKANSDRLTIIEFKRAFLIFVTTLHPHSSISKSD